MIRFAFFLLAGVAAFGQSAPRLVSPEVLPDHRITFRLSAPKASDVQLRFGEGAPQTHAMAKDGNGVWSVTIGPVEPEIYTYSFVVDGVKTIDLANPMAKIGASIDASVVDVPGNPPRFDQVQDVPHGSINIHTYASAVSKTQRGLYVYVPPDYYSLPASGSRCCTCGTEAAARNWTGAAMAEPASSWTTSSPGRRPSRC